MTTAPATTRERLSAPGTMAAMRESGGPPGAAEILAMLRRRTVLIVVLTLFFSALVVGGFLAWWVYWPGYSSESMIECISNIPETQLTFEQQRLRQDEHERFVRTQAFLMKSPAIMGEALKVSAVRETDWFKDVLRRQREPLLELNRELGAAALRGTNFLRVAMETKNPADAPVIINEVVTLWYHTVKQRTAEEFASEALAAGQQELDALERQMTLDRERLKGIAQRLPPGAVQNPAANITAQQVRQFGEQVALHELELSQLEQYRSIYGDPDGVAVTAEDRAAVEQDLHVAELARAAFLLEQQRAADEKVYGPGHAVLRQLDARIEAARNKLDQLRLEKLRERRADMREATNTAYDNTRYSLFVARENLAKAEAALQDQDRLLFDYFDLEAKIKQDGEFKLQLSNFVKSLSRVKTQRTAIQVSIAQPAIPALERSSPSKFMIPVGLIFSLALAMIIGLGLEMMDKSVRTAQDIERHIDLPVLGAIPHTDDEEVAIERVETAVRDAPRSMVAEAFRRIRTNLQFSAPVDKQRSLLVTGPRPEDGTTSVACNLAIAAAQAGRRVLLIDANLRRPGVHRVFGLPNQEGLSNLLIGETTLDQTKVASGQPSLDLIVSGPTPPNPAELLGGDGIRTLLQEVAGRYDQVIVDTAPVLLAGDAVLLSTLVDGVVLVIRANRNSRGAARRASSLLADVGSRRLGAILNAAQVTRGGYFREQLRSYYEYSAGDKKKGG